MSLSENELNRIVEIGAPILCIDTCSVLDIMRDLTRESIRSHDAEAALNLLIAAESNIDLVGLIAQQVKLELNDHLKPVAEDAEKALENLRKQIERIDKIASVFGASGNTNTNHLYGHVNRARKVVDRWIAVATLVPQSDDVVNKAFFRVNSAKTPAKKGKESMKDCVVIETYLELVAALRGAGLTSKVVFASSNVKDYCSETGTRLKEDIASEFSALGMGYATNLGAAKHLLGL